MTIDTAGPNPKLPPYPVTMYPAGRFMLPVPAGLGISSSVFTVNKIIIGTAKTAVCQSRLRAGRFVSAKGKPTFSDDFLLRDHFKRMECFLSSS
jgi:hypothetical protein